MIWPALILGFAGSVHCIGMCGPLAMSVGANQVHFGKFLFNKLLYNSGRIFTYGLLGLLVGSLGWGVKLAGYQQLLSVAFGIVMLLFVISSITGRFNMGELKPLQWLHGQIRSMFSSILSQKNYTKWFLLGLANGILPCGFVYVALSASGLQASPVSGMWFMMLFGLGTFPALFIVSFTGNLLSLNSRKFLSRYSPYLISALAALLILRGLNLGVPYISPKVVTATEEVVVMKCCVKPD